MSKLECPHRVVHDDAVVGLKETGSDEPEASKDQGPEADQDVAPTEMPREAPVPQPARAPQRENRQTELNLEPALTEVGVPV